MLSLKKKLFRKFSTLIIPDPNKFSTDVQSLLTAGEAFKEPIEILHLGSNTGDLEKRYKEDINHPLLTSISLAEDSRFNNNDYEMSYGFLRAYLEQKSFDRLLMGNSPISKELLPRLSILYNAQAITDVISVIDKETFLRPIYAGNAISKVRFTGPKTFIGVRLTNFEKSQKSEENRKFEITKINTEDYLKGVESKVNVLENKVQESERPDLSDARVVISGGRALKSAENFGMLYDLADKIPGSAVGASRAAVDAGYIGNDLQIGQTGKIVAPDLYFAFGISGAIQHVAGMKDSKIVVAVNKDPECPIFSIADYGLTGDLFKILPELIEKVDKA